MHFQPELKSLQAMLGTNGIITSQIKDPTHLAEIVNVLWGVPIVHDVYDNGHMVKLLRTIKSIPSKERRMLRIKNISKLQEQGIVSEKFLEEKRYVKIRDKYMSKFKGKKKIAASEKFKQWKIKDKEKNAMKRYNHFLDELIDGGN
jgi:hypothetical protein